MVFACCVIKLAEHLAYFKRGSPINEKKKSIAQEFPFLGDINYDRPSTSS